MRARAGAEAGKILAEIDEVVVAIGLPGAHLLAHEEHRRRRAEQRDAGGEVNARLGVTAGLADQRRAVHRHHDGAGGMDVLSVLLVLELPASSCDS